MTGEWGVVSTEERLQEFEPIVSCQLEPLIEGCLRAASSSERMPSCLPGLRIQFHHLIISREGWGEAGEGGCEVCGTCACERVCARKRCVSEVCVCLCVCVCV